LRRRAGRCRLRDRRERPPVISHPAPPFGLANVDET
jgi:hypothetical protein